MKLTLDNFRCFKSQAFDFSRINILIGENSSGKSSILKFYLALMQSMADPHGLNLKLFGSHVDLANYNEIIYCHDTDNKLSFSFEFGEDYRQYFFALMLSPRRITSAVQREELNKEMAKSLGNAVNVPTKIKFTLDINLERHSSIYTEISNPELGKLVIEHHDYSQEANSDDLTIGQYKTCCLIYEVNGTKYKLDDIDFQEEAFTSIIISPSLREHCEKNLNDPSLFYKIGFLLVTQNYLKRFISSIKFVNPIHSAPARFYSERDRSSLYVSMTIENLVTILGDRSLSPKIKERMMTDLNEALRFYGLAEEIDLVGGGKMPVVELKAKIKGLWSNITDVGYGVSLQLPILFQTIISNGINGETILIEQPEVHLHPKLQANFIETLLKIGPKNTYYIETHSEHIIRKLQVLVKNKAYGLSAKDVSIHYLSREKEKSIVTKHRIDEQGKLNPSFPTGFFDSSYLLAKKLI